MLKNNFKYVILNNGLLNYKQTNRTLIKGEICIKL